jgi:hypothetical protein
VTKRVSIRCTRFGIFPCPALSWIVTRAGVARRIPVEAMGADEDGVPIYVLLHVVDGAISSVEVFRDDGGEIRRMPSVDSLDVVAI